MTRPAETTLNVSVEQIETALLGGQTVPDFANEWSEPPANVLAVFRRLQREGRIPTNAPSQVATPAPRPLVSVPSQNDEPPSVDALIGAAERSSSKRTKALGVKLADLASVLRTRLANEREAAEAERREKATRDAAAAEVARLEAALREARAKAGVGKRATSTAQREATAKLHVDTPCPKGCGRIAKSKAGAAAHARHCGGAA